MASARSSSHAVMRRLYVHPIATAKATAIGLPITGTIPAAPSTTCSVTSRAVLFFGGCSTREECHEGETEQPSALGRVRRVDHVRHRAPVIRGLRHDVQRPRACSRWSPSPFWCAHRPWDAR